MVGTQGVRTVAGGWIEPSSSAPSSLLSVFAGRGCLVGLDSCGCVRSGVGGLVAPQVEAEVGG